MTTGCQKCNIKQARFKDDTLLCLDHEIEWCEWQIQGLMDKIEKLKKRRKDNELANVQR